MATPVLTVVVEDHAAIGLRKTGVHKEAHLSISNPFQSSFESINSGTVDSIFVQFIPPIDDSFRKEMFSKIQMTTPFIQFQMMSSQVAVAGPFKEVIKWNVQFTSSHLVNLDQISSVASFFQRP